MIAVFPPFLLAIVIPFFYRWTRGLTGYCVALLPAVLMGYFLSLFPTVLSQGAIRQTFSWAPSLGIELSFYLDGLGMLMLLLILGIGVLIFIYAQRYLHKSSKTCRFYVIMLIFLGAMMGLVTGGNLIVLFIFWELTSISSYLLIGFRHEDEKARYSALQALLVTGLGGLALFAAFLLIKIITGSYDLQALLHGDLALQGHSWYPIIVVLVLLGAFTKSAQVPFHFWLPNAMAAPTPVSAYLHSATMVKAGIFLLARFTPVLGGTSFWTITVAGVGAITLLTGGWLALIQDDLKRVLAYSTMSVLGMLTFLIGIGTQATIYAAMIFLLAHALYKAALFLTVGIVEHETGTRELSHLKGLYRFIPLTALIAGVAGLSQAGLPPLFGFIAKEYAYEAVLKLDSMQLLATGIPLIGSMWLTAIGFQVGIMPYIGRLPHTLSEKKSHCSLILNSAPLVLAVLSLLFGLMPAFFCGQLISSAVQGAYGLPSVKYLALWHGWNTALLLSAITLIGGVLLLASRTYLLGIAGRFGSYFVNWGPEKCYQRMFNHFITFSQWQTQILQSGSLRRYILFILTGIVGLLSYALWQTGLLYTSEHWNSSLSFFYESGILIGLTLITIAATIFAVRSRSVLSSIIVLGVVGYSVAIIFILNGAPDLAVTQILVETLIVVLLAFALYRLPRFKDFSSCFNKRRDLLLSLLFGGMMSVITLNAMSLQLQPSISSYFAENSLKLAHGRNVVNVILVDFRALDTLGEIVVLSVAALGVFALMRLTSNIKK